MFCPRCGTQLDNNVRFCGGCGYKFENAPSAAPAANAPAQPQYTQVTPPVMPQVQQPAPQPQVQQPQAQAKKTNSVMIFFVTFLVLGAIAAAVMLFVYPGWLAGGDDDDDDSSSKKAKDSSSVSQVDSDSSDDSDEEDESSADDDESSQEETAATTTTSAPETEPPETTTTTTADILAPPNTVATTAAPPSGGNNDDDFTEAMNFSTNERPGFDEFDWCYGQNDLIRSAPAGAQKLSTAGSIAGGWKAMFVYSQGKSSEMLARELNNITFDVKQNNVTATIDWYYMEIPGSEDENEEALDDESFEAAFSGGSLSGTFYDNEIKITEFWKENGKEYAYGEYSTAEGIYIYIALVR